jgi:hypothetical protein
MTKKSLRIYFCGSKLNWNFTKFEDFEYVQILSKHFDVDIVDDIDADYFFVNETFSSRLDYLRKFRWEVVSILISGEAFVPDFNLFDYALGFDHIQFQDRYLRFNIAHRFQKHLELTPEKVSQSIRPHFCDFVYSNFLANENRDRLFYELSQYKTVCSYGKHLNNAGSVLETMSRNHSWMQAKVNLESTHKFSISAENALHIGYTSEKVFDAFAANSIPIYWGNPQIFLDVNPERVISAHSFKTMEDLRQYVKLIDQDDELYRQIISRPFFTENQVNATIDYPQVLEAFLLNIFEPPTKSAIRKGIGTFNNTYFELNRFGFSLGNKLRMANELRKFHALPKRLKSRLRNSIVRRFSLE